MAGLNPDKSTTLYASVDHCLLSLGSLAAMRRYLTDQLAASMAAYCRTPERADILDTA